MRKLLLSLMSLFSLCGFAQGVKASFMADEAVKPYYQMGWDSVEEANTWKYLRVNSGATWTLIAKPRVKGLPDFTAFDPKSKYSLFIPDSNGNQNETTISPEIEILPNSKCQFYSCFSGIFLFSARWTLSIIDVASSESKTLLDAFMWAQEMRYDGPNWQKFDIDLSEYAGKKVRFSFSYKGTQGEDVLIDGFKLMQTDSSESSSVTINEGEEVHFQNTSEGNIQSYKWTFTGGTPSESTDKNPTVRYDQAGTYPVTLTVSDGTSTNTYTRKAYIHVVTVAPKAWIGLPEEGYQSPYTACFVPTDVPVQFKDLSEGRPTEWNWTFNGTNIESSTEQNPVVKYIKQGVFSVALRSFNSAGVNTDILQKAIQAGGEQYVWNISPDESENLKKIALGYYGNYAGSNFLGMRKFAEHFHQPLVKSTIKEVGIFFVSTTSISPDSIITVSIAKADAKGMPGQVLGKSSLKVSQLALFTNDNPVATKFKFDTPIEINEEFFVVIEGIPGVADNNGVDDIAILALKRDDNGKSTTYHELAEEDEKYQYTGRYFWYKSDDTKVSLGVCPLLTYTNIPTIIKAATTDASTTGLRFDGTQLYLDKQFDRLDVYTLSGNSVLSISNPNARLSLQALPAGMYIVKGMCDKSPAVLKIVKR